MQTPTGKPQKKNRTGHGLINPTSGWPAFKVPPEGWGSTEVLNVTDLWGSERYCTYWSCHVDDAPHSATAAKSEKEKNSMILFSSVNVETPTPGVLFKHFINCVCFCAVVTWNLLQFGILFKRGLAPAWRTCCTYFYIIWVILRFECIPHRNYDLL